MKFRELPLADSLLEGIEAMRYEETTPIQEEAIPIIQAGTDLIACAQTGTGKTGAFIIPVVNRMIQTKGKGVRCLILVPTRELAIQIDQNLDGLSYFTGVASQAVYGGNQSDNFVAQKQAIQSGTEILIATPGRLLSYLNLGILSLQDIEVLILDEADRMLDMGFISDIRKIVSKCSTTRQTLLFSATMASGIRKLAQEILENPKQINLAIAKPAEGINQQGFLVHDGNKIQLLKHILTNEHVKNMIVFTSTKEMADKTYRELVSAQIKARAIHSGKDQDERNETLRLFKSGEFVVLIATDILSRGIDIDELSHVVNFDVPDDPADYVHRIGRTARAGSKGAAYTFINESQQPRFYNIELLIERTVDKQNTPESIGESPLYEPTKKRPQKGGRGNHGKFRSKGKGKPRGNEQPRNHKPKPRPKRRNQDN